MTTELEETPRQLPQTNPPGSYPMADYSFTLQAVMDLQKTVGQLTEAVNSLKNTIEKQDSRFNRIEEKLSGVTHKLYAAGVVLAILLALGGFIVNKAWDLMVQRLTMPEMTNPSQSIPVPPTRSPTKK